jgi:hypothetical protein
MKSVGSNDNWSLPFMMQGDDLMLILGDSQGYGDNHSCYVGFGLIWNGSARTDMTVHIFKIVSICFLIDR